VTDEQLSEADRAAERFGIDDEFNEDQADPGDSAGDEDGQEFAPVPEDPDEP
jgi:hypothetical protein